MQTDKRVEREDDLLRLKIGRQQKQQQNGNLSTQQLCTLGEFGFESCNWNTWTFKREHLLKFNHGGLTSATLMLKHTNLLLLLLLLHGAWSLLKCNVARRAHIMLKITSQCVFPLNIIHCLFKNHRIAIGHGNSSSQCSDYRVDHFYMVKFCQHAKGCTTNENAYE